MITTKDDGTIVYSLEIAHEHELKALLTALDNRDRELSDYYNKFERRSTKLRVAIEKGHIITLLNKANRLADVI